MEGVKDLLPYVAGSEFLTSALILAGLSVWLLNQYVGVQKSLMEIRTLQGDNKRQAPHPSVAFKLSIAFAAGFAITFFRYALPEIFPHLEVLQRMETFQVSIWPRYGQAVGMGAFPLIGVAAAFLLVGRAGATRDYVLVCCVVAVLVPFVISALLYTFPATLGGTYCEALVDPSLLERCKSEWQ